MLITEHIDSLRDRLLAAGLKLKPVTASDRGTSPWSRAHAPAGFSVSWDVDIFQPTIRLAKVSMTKATQTKPRQVNTKVKSDTQRWLGVDARNCPFSLSNGQCSVG